MCKCTQDNLHLVHSVEDSCLVIELCTAVFAWPLAEKPFVDFGPLPLSPSSENSVWFY